MAIDIVARALAVSGKQSLENYYTKTESDAKYSQATNLANGTADVLIQTTDTNQSFKVISDGRAKVYGTPTESTDVVRLGDLKNYTSLLQNGIGIAEGTDLNTLTNVGSYYCSLDTTAATLLNSPTVSAFTMKVFLGNGVSSAFIKQEIKLYSNTNYYTRYSNNSGSTWSGWYRYTTDSEVVLKNTASYDQVYTRNYDGITSGITYTRSVVSNTIPYRDSNSNFKVGTITDDYSDDTKLYTANLEYVENRTAVYVDSDLIGG